MIRATVTGRKIYPEVAAPRKVFCAITAPPAPVNSHGLLYDADTGAFLFDEVTGSPLTW